MLPATLTRTSKRMDGQMDEITLKNSQHKLSVLPLKDVSFSGPTHDYHQFGLHMTSNLLTWHTNTSEKYLDSIIFFAASAYFSSSFRASSLYLMRDNLKQNWSTNAFNIKTAFLTKGFNEWNTPMWQWQTRPGPSFEMSVSHYLKGAGQWQGHSQAGETRPVENHLKGQRQYGPDGDVIHDLTEHGRGNDGVTFTGQQGVGALIHHLPLKQPAVERLSRGLDPWVEQAQPCLKLLHIKIFQISKHPQYQCHLEIGFDYYYSFKTES